MIKNFQDGALPPSLLAADKRLVIVSDCNGTLICPKEGVSFNKNLFEVLIYLKQQGHHVLIASDSPYGLDGVFKLRLSLMKMDKHFFDIGADYNDGTVIHKNDLPRVIKSLTGRDKVDYVFDDDEDISYVPYHTHIHPKYTLDDDHITQLQKVFVVDYSVCGTSS